MLLLCVSGMGFQPMPDVEYTLVRFTMSKDQNTEHIRKVLDRKLLPVAFCVCLWEWKRWGGRQRKGAE